jgi:hypothetical protein
MSWIVASTSSALSDRMMDGSAISPTVRRLLLFTIDVIMSFKMIG